MGNTESVVVQKRLARFRPDERPVVEAVFNKVQGSSGGKTLTLEILQVRVEILLLVELLFLTLLHIFILLQCLINHLKQFRSKKKNI